MRAPGSRPPGSHSGAGGSRDDRRHPLVSGRIFYGYVVAAAAFVAWFMAWGSFQAFGVFFKPLLADFGWTRAMTAGAVSLSAIVRGSLGIIMGRLTDRLGPRKVVLVFGSLLGIGYILMSQVRSLWQYDVIYAVLIGAGLGATAVPIMATVARWFARRRAMMMGIVQSGSSLGGLVLAPLAAWLILRYDWRWSYVILGLLSLALIIPAALFLRRDPGEMGLLPDGAGDRSVRQDEKKTMPHPGEAGISVRQAVRSRRFWMLLVIFFSFGFCRSTIVVHIAAHTTDLGFSLATAAKVLGTVSGIGIIGRIGMGRLADIIGNRPALIISFSLIAASLVWVAVTDELWTLYVFALAFGFGWSALAAIRMPITAETFGLRSIGAILGLVEVGAEVGAISGPFLAGLIFDVYGGYERVFILSAAIAAVGLITTALLGFSGKRPSAATLPHP